jgi:hypothetical protein
MKRKLAWSVVGVMAGVVALYIYLDSRAKRAAEEAQKLRIEAETKAAVSKLVSQYNAVDDWEKRLCNGETHRTHPMLTIELERAWQSERPILFIGAIKDISSAGTDAYSIVLERGQFGTEYTLSTELRLRLRASKAEVDSMLNRHPALLSADRPTKGIAVIAKVKAINTIEERDADGEHTEIRIGEGDLLGLVYVGSLYYRGRKDSNSDPDPPDFN